MAESHKHTDKTKLFITFHLFTCSFHIFTHADGMAVAAVARVSTAVSLFVCLSVCFSARPQLHCKFNVLFQPTQTDARRAASRPSCCTQRCILSVINWWPTPVAFYHSERPRKLLTPVTVNVQLRNFLSPEFGTKFIREVPLFLRHLTFA